jgi:hypothetical protein
MESHREDLQDKIRQIQDEMETDDHVDLSQYEKSIQVHIPLAVQE